MGKSPAVVVAGAAVAAALVSPGALSSAAARRPAASPPAAAASYGWPVKPFGRSHPIRGVFGEPRTIFAGPPTWTTLMRGGGSFSFHSGVDIYAPDGTPVYAVEGGDVTFAGGDHVNVQNELDGRVFSYWHLRPRVGVGEQVAAFETILGTIRRGNNHVHLTEYDDGALANPLQAGHLTPYRDRTTPRIERIWFRRGGSAAELMPLFVRGSVDMVAAAYDEPGAPVPGLWRGFPIPPALVTWRVALWTGEVVVPDTVAADFRQGTPPRSQFWRIYARGTYQNMPVFGKHFSNLEPGRYLFRLTPTSFDTHQLRDGVYDLVVTASDVRGNSSSRALRFTVHNRPGRAG